MRFVFRREKLKLAVAFLFAAGLLFSCQPKANEAAREGKTAGYLSYLEDVSVFNIQDNKTVWSASSRKATLTGDGSTANLEKVSLNVPSENLSLKANGGVLDLDRNTLNLTGRIESEVKGFQMDTDSLRIVPGGKVSSPANDMVSLKKERILIEGKGIETDSERTVKLKNNVKAIFY
ncbi:MAG: hypothetical protein M0Z59_07340 [Nitrospiraceae bacterium]|nr:hypothetical protein [Nitrospiraceae bacterium]